MECRCLRCDRSFTLTDEEAGRVRSHFERRGLEPPLETVGICNLCWEPGPEERPNVSPSGSC